MKITYSDGSVKELKNSDAVALAVLRHSAAHVMARAVMRLYGPIHKFNSPAVPMRITASTTTSLWNTGSPKRIFRHRSR
ncbi:MAG: hypothetical protein LBH00_02830 [Planctomycetaceae bacterium]|jgi:hypothetical protein|nr:hypothetical protein [Planctomycetaceae bacterium]